MRFFDLALQEPETRAAFDAAYARVMDSGWMILGPELATFEAEFAAYCGAAHAVGVGNGLDALVLALRAGGVAAGSEVIVPAHTFAATWLAVEAVGARPVPVEVDADLYVMDAQAVATAIGPRTAAVIPVSLYGHPVDMDPILDLAGRHGLFVLEDAAQSHGARCRGRRTGGLAHATAFSFYPTKNLGALGDGGAVTTSDAALADRLRMLRNYGSRRKYVHEAAGVNSRLDELQAAFLRVGLQRLDAANALRRERAERYRIGLAGVNGLTLPSEADWAEHAYHLFVVRTAGRDALRARLETADVETLIHYPTACHLQPAFAHLGLKAGDLPGAEALAREVLSLPLWPRMPLADVDRVAAAIRGRRLGMEERAFETPFGPIVLVGEPAAFEGTRPLVVTIAGAFAIARGPLFQLTPLLAPMADVVSGHLPGNHSPTLAAASVGVYAAAYSHVISTAFAGRTVIGCGASIGGLVALGLRAPEVRNLLVIEPPLVMSKLWPMWPTLRRKLTEGHPAARDFIVNVFGVTETTVAERRYETTLDALRKPTHVIVGDRPLFPERRFEKLPSLVDEPERVRMAAHPCIRLSVAPDSGHNVLQESTPAFLAALREAIRGAPD